MSNQSQAWSEMSASNVDPGGEVGWGGSRGETPIISLTLTYMRIWWDARVNVDTGEQPLQVEGGVIGRSNQFAYEANKVGCHLNGVM